jgi:hypothetical protein
MSPPSSPPFSKISSEEAPQKPHSLRYAESDQDACEIHAFLLTVARPALRCEVNFLKSLLEIQRVVHDEAALMISIGNTLIGTMGLIRPQWWYGDDVFLTDRWHFVLPEHDGSPAARALIEEAEAIARGAGIDFIHQGRMRQRRPGTYFMWPRITAGG